jgi:hypothetical protein
MPSSTITAVAAATLGLLARTATGVPQPAARRSLQLHDQQFEDTVMPTNGNAILWGKSVRPSVTELQSSVGGHSTYALELTPVGDADTIYALYGHAAVPLELPPAYQVAAPFGTHIGGTRSELWAFTPDAEYDSFVFAAADVGADKISSIGIDFDSWSPNAGVSCDNGAVFLLDPNTATPGPLLAAQLTIPAGAGFTVTMGAQGHEKIDPAFQAMVSEDPAVTDPRRARQSWNQELVQFSVAGTPTPTPVPTGH